jgi:hypothetical protein
MRLRNIVAAVAAVAITASATSPAFAHHHYWKWVGSHYRHHHFAGGSHFNAWPAFYIIGAAASVELNAVIVWNAQCRELTSQEALTSAFLPILGIALDERDNKCKH